MNSGRKKDAKKENMVLTLALWLVLGCGCMASMLYVASRKTIVIADTVREESSMEAGTAGNQETNDHALLFVEEKEEKDCIRIPLEKGTKAESVVMENRYTDRELWIYLQDASEEFYEVNPICGDLAPMQKGSFETNRDGVVLKLSMDDVLEYRSTMENDTLVVAYYKPVELYEQIVVVDPAGGGSETGSTAAGYSEKEVALQVAKQLQKRPEQEGIKIYFTRLEDEDVSEEERLALVEAVDADVFIRIRACEDASHPEYYGIHGFFNEEYFVPEFGNVQLADILTRNVTVSASNRAIGLTPASEDSILYDLEIPAAEICVGYLSNEQESALLQQEFYQQKLAEGLANAILEVYTNKNVKEEMGES